MSTTKSAVFFLLSLFLIPARADQTQDIARIKSAAKDLFPGAELAGITPSPIAGLYEVIVGPNLLYFSADGRHVVTGDIVEAKSSQNLTAPRRDGARVKVLAGMAEKDMFVFAPAKPAKHTVTVFTDPDCGYCRKFHKEMKDYNDAGIKVRYLMFPRAGVGSKSFEKAVDAWCAPDRNAALTKAKNGEPLEHRQCDNPVERQMTLGELVGVTGTPTILTERGKLIPGYVPAARLAKFLEDGELEN